VPSSATVLRSRIMASVKSRQTTPEVMVQESLSRLGIRFSTSCSDLPGTPDLVVRDRGQVIFVHGCFWHGHSCARGSRVPATNRTYWRAKIARNKTRDQRTARQLRRMGLSVATVWECRIRNADALDKRLNKLLTRAESRVSRRLLRFS
jgi:DNA mismatch endonuclease (patch repair protein)